MVKDDFVSEFLYHDPDSGMAVTMILDHDGFRPVTAMEEAAISLDWIGMPVQIQKSHSDMVHQSLGDFITRYAKSFCMDAEEELSGWDLQPQLPC